MKCAKGPSIFLLVCHPEPPYFDGEGSFARLLFSHWLLEMLAVKVQRSQRTLPQHDKDFVQPTKCEWFSCLVPCLKEVQA
jgi:hypothetical protein